MTKKRPGRARARLPAAIVVLLTTMAPIDSKQREPRPGRLSGVIIDADTGAPLRAARVVVTSPTSKGAAVTAVSDSAGRFEVPALSPGTYIVTASLVAYVEATFGRRHQIDDGGTVDVGPGQQRNRVDFQLSRESAVAGRVVGADGQARSNLVVSVSRPHVLDGQRRLVSFGSARTDGAGEYRVGGLLAGDYYVSVALFEGSDSRDAKYAPTFYPASAGVATAKRVRLDSGKVTRIADVTPLAVPWVRLSGMMKSSDGKPLLNGALIMQPADPDHLSFSPDAVSRIFPDGRFTFDFVVPGHYIVRAIGSTGPRDSALYASWPVRVEGQPIPEQLMILQPGSKLQGSARFESHGTPRPADLTSIRIHAPLVDASGFAMASEARLSSDATFTLTSVDAGRRLIRVDGPPAPWSLSRVTQGGRDITDDALDITQGQTLQDVELVFTDVVTGLTGAVRSHAGTPLVNYMVVVFPVDRALWRPQSRYIGATRTDWEGRYRLVSLPPGQYRVAAVNDFEEEEIHERDALDQISLRAVPALLTLGAVRTQDLVVTIGQRSGGAAHLER